MKFNNNILERYLSLAPIPLAFERVLESKIYKSLSFVRPILDIGCGEGLFSKVVFGEKIDTGIDPNTKELARAHELNAYNELTLCKGNAIDKPDGYYKTIFSNSVLEHIPDIEPVFCEAHRLLSKDGKFYITVPSHRFDEYTVVNQMLSAVGLYGFATKYRRSFNKFWHHYHYYTPDGWSELAQRNGFKVIVIQTYGTKGICLLNDFLAPFSIISFIIKKLTNKWVLFPRLRRLMMIPVVLAGSRLLEGGDKVKDGGLIFMELKKI